MTGAVSLNATVSPGLTINGSGAASVSPLLMNGVVLTGGTGTTNFPALFLQPTGTTAATTWSTSGTGLGMNLASAFAGNFLDFHAGGGTSLFSVNSSGSITSAGTVASAVINSSLIRGGTSASVAMIIESTSGSGTTDSISFKTGSQVVAATIDTKQNVILNNAAVATNATDGFLYVATCAGTPTGTPTTFTGRVPLIYDTTNHQFWIYDSGWKQPKTPAGAALVTWQ